MKSKKNSDKIPRTGRVGRFAKIVEKETDSNTFIHIMKDSSEYSNFKPEETALWWKGAIERLEKKLGKDKAIEIMETCGSKCCGAGQRKLAKKMMEESSSLEEFLEKLGSHRVKDGELTYILADKNTIIARHNRCFCGQVKQSKELFKNDIYCQCSVEFNKTFFEAALEQEVAVTLKSSILNGDEYCEFEVKI